MPPSNVAVHEGETAQFTAKVLPCLPTPNIFWYFVPENSSVNASRRPLEECNKYHMETGDGGNVSLLITAVEMNDAGQYIMAASSSAGIVETAASLTVHGSCFYCST
jgi:hypothetical protein